jgi:hypothetical protein
MLKQLQNAAVIVLAVLFAIGFGVQVWRASEAPHASINQNAAAHKKDKTDSETIEERHQATEEAIAYYNKWLMFFTAILAIATFGLGVATVGLYRISERQLRHAELQSRRARVYRAQDEMRIEEQIGIAKASANAAKLNAEAVMAAEGAALYPLIGDDNLKAIFGAARRYERTGQDSEPFPAPAVTFRFKNYGKTPAVLISVMHGLDFFPKPSKLRTMHAEDISFIEVIAPDKETRDMTAALYGSTFTREKAKVVRDGPGQLLFFGQAIFKDFFNRQFLCIWECEGDNGGFRLIRHEQREDPDAKG